MMKVAVIDQAQPRGVIAAMADKFGMRPDAFEATVRATCSPAGRRGEEPVLLTREEFAAFMLVASHYDLNPLTREIYAYPRRGGGVVPIVSVDGWLKLINRQPTCDGFNVVANLGHNGALVSYTCTMYRKDRVHPIVVTEYLSECVRETEPWKMKHRMLRHKALIQAGRYAFGFAGIYDEDEAERIVGETPSQSGPPAPLAPTTRLPPPPPPAPAPKAAGPPPPPWSQTPPAPPPPKPAPFDFDGFRAALKAATTEQEANDIFDERLSQMSRHMTDDDLSECDAIMREVCRTFDVEEGA